jgi:hypothetical protein
MSDAAPLAEATLKGCAANVGPLIGLELKVGEVSLETTADPPQASWRWSR